jgi:hypothetical protein
MILILNFVYTVVFYAMRWIKLYPACICFELFVNQFNLSYICIYLYLQQHNSYVTHELGRGSFFFAVSSLAQWAASDFLKNFYVFNFGVVFFMHIWFVFILS